MSKVSISIPKTKKTGKTIDISDVRPCDILKFMDDNHIPDTAYFGGIMDGR
jgi:hypothetical protein